MAYTQADMHREAREWLKGFLPELLPEHLLLTPKAAEDIPRLIIALGRRFVQTISKTYRRPGTLWDSRYKSSLIQTDTYLLRCQRDIELNPERADMVRDPGEYAWSSDRANGLAGRFCGIS